MCGVQAIRDFVLTNRWVTDVTGMDGQNKITEPLDMHYRTWVALLRPPPKYSTKTLATFRRNSAEFPPVSNNRDLRLMYPSLGGGVGGLLTASPG